LLTWYIWEVLKLIKQKQRCDGLGIGVVRFMKSRGGSAVICRENGGGVLL